MGKLSELFKSSYGKIKSLSRGKKIAFGVSLVGVLTVIIYLSVTLGATKYGILFKDLEANEAKLVIDKLKEKKITDYKVSGNTISVPASMVEELRLDLAPEITSGDKGWELFESGNTFSSTDTELKIKYQRALQAELERTIKGFPQIEKARVALVLPEESVFVKDSTPASASVTLIMKSGQNLTVEQVKSIVALVSGSVKNLPKENVQVVDDKLKLLSKDLFNEDNATVSADSEKQQQLKKDYEKLLEGKVMEQLSKPFKNKVTVKVNADLDFDAVQSVSTIVDPKGAVVSEQYERNTNGNTTTRPSQSPVDNNMTNNTPGQDTTVNSNDVTYQKETKNYENGKNETKTVKAPGSVKRVTASVIIDGNLELVQRDQVKNLVAGAIGFNETRGDVITVEGIAFDNTDMEAAKKAVEDLKASEDKAARTKLYTQLAIGGVAALALITLIIAFVRKGRKRSPQEEQLDAIVSPKGLDVLLGDDEPNLSFKPIDFEKQGNNERAHIENEIKRYATEKPDQVVDIIKSWLAEEER
ncbi:flagellar M-ring protein FliF [Clostridium swellfunianum]|uniref:flagellar basal-body MS-ring/collar protein FliF n=1 Tax=Clostridium swellfunianum TaxID=1367462 RepID=UPI00202E4832|nr:flagellar basal-body MS-ring/collar protein FliF [Clostridium swellfunianum]MCM0650451.1 flagellar M-ring protein FliF [Clostridium swellfunianum]